MVQSAMRTIASPPSKVRGTCVKSPGPTSRWEPKISSCRPPRSCALAGLSTKCEPHGPVLRQRDELQTVPEVIGLAQVDAPQRRPVLVEPSGRSDLICGPVRLARSLAGLRPYRNHVLNEGQGLERHASDDGQAETTRGGSRGNESH